MGLRGRVDLDVTEADPHLRLARRLHGDTDGDQRGRLRHGHQPRHGDRRGRQAPHRHVQHRSGHRMGEGHARHPHPDLASATTRPRPAPYVGPWTGRTAVSPRCGALGPRSTHVYPRRWQLHADGDADRPGREQLHRDHGRGDSARRHRRSHCASAAPRRPVLGGRLEDPEGSRRRRREWCRVGARVRDREARRCLVLLPARLALLGEGHEPRRRTPQGPRGTRRHRRRQPVDLPARPASPQGDPGPAAGRGRPRREPSHIP